MIGDVEPDRCTYAGALTGFPILFCTCINAGESPGSGSHLNGADIRIRITAILHRNSCAVYQQSGGQDLHNIDPECAGNTDITARGTGRGIRGTSVFSFGQGMVSPRTG